MHGAALQEAGQGPVEIRLVQQEGVVPFVGGDFDVLMNIMVRYTLLILNH